VSGGRHPMRPALEIVDDDPSARSSLAWAQEIRTSLFVLLGPSFSLTSCSGSGEFPAIYKRISIFTEC